MVPNGKGECDGGGGGGNASPEGATGRKLKKGPWTAAEDAILVEHVRKYGEGNWNSVQRNSSLARCGKSCRLRWANHLRPDLKKGSFTPEEERLILELHAKYGNKWARMAAQIPGRTDNEIKNFWNTRMKRRLRQGLPLYPQEIQNTLSPNHRALTPLSPATPTISLVSPHHHFSPQLISPKQSYHSPTLSFSSHLNHHHHPLPVSHPPPILHPPLYRFGRLRNTLATTTHPIASPAPSPSPIMASPLSTPLSQFSTPQLSPMNFEAKSPPPTIHTQFKVDDLMFDDSSFAVKSEIPSNQPFQTWPLDAVNDSAPGVNSGKCGYLVERSEGHQAMVSDNALRRGDLEKQHAGDGFGSLYCNSSSSHYCPPSSENNSTEAPIDMIDLKHEDLSEFLTTLPLSTQAVDWFGNAASGQSNWQSSVVIDDAGNSIRMQEQLSSPFLIPDSLENASCSWSHMPQIH